MCKTALAPGQLLRSIHIDKCYLGIAGYTPGNTPLETAPGHRQAHMKEWQTSDRRPRQNQPGAPDLPRFHVNRP